MRRPARFTLGDMALDVLPDGRVLVILPVERVPFGAEVHATAVYPSLRALIAARRERRDG